MNFAPAKWGGDSEGFRFGFNLVDDMKIARQFTGGKRCHWKLQSRQGQLRTGLENRRSVVPTALGFSALSFPATEVAGYFQPVSTRPVPAHPHIWPPEIFLPPFAKTAKDGAPPSVRANVGRSMFPLKQRSLEWATWADSISRRFSLA